MTFFPEGDEWMLCGKWISKGVLGPRQDEFLPSKACFHSSALWWWGRGCTSCVIWLSIKFCHQEALERLAKGNPGIFTFDCSIIFFPIATDSLHLSPASFVLLSTSFASSSTYPLVVDMPRVRLLMFRRAGAKCLSEASSYSRIMAALGQFTQSQI